MREKDQKHRVGTADIDFRTPIEDDLEAIQAGWNRTVPQDPLDNWARSLRDFVLLSEEEGLSRVATLDDEVIGFASVIGGALRAIYVEDPYRRQGIGDTLLSGMIEFAREKGWNQLAVATSHNWVGTMPGIDIRYETAVRFLEHRGFERERLLTDVEADFQDIETASRRRPLERVCTVSEYHPDEIEDIRAFDSKRDTSWVWSDFIAKYPLPDPKRVRLVARVEGRLVGCVDVKISGGVAGLAYISVEHAYRHKGIGSALLREVASACRQRGATSMFAGMAVREFYEVNGWRVQREFVAMAKPLNG